MRTRLRHLVVLALLGYGLPATAHAQVTAAQPAPGAVAFAEGVRLHDGGKPADAVPFFKQAIAEGYRPTFQGYVRLARAYAKSGQPDLALGELEKLASGGFANVAVLSMPDFDSLREQPRFEAVTQKMNAAAHPCDADPNYHAFDFWIGEWDVQPTGPNRGPMGSGSTSLIERQLDGCVIQENWLPLGGVGQGKSFNIYNAVTKQWEQYYVDSRATVTHYTGTFHDDGNLYYEADQFGSTNKLRMTFFNQGPNQVRQLGHVSTDGGKTWTVSFDLTYVRKPPKA